MSESPRPTDAGRRLRPNPRATAGGHPTQVSHRGGAHGRDRRDPSRWRVEIATSDSPDDAPWIATHRTLPVERRPQTLTPAPDRFVWSIRVRTPRSSVERELPDGAVARRPWRDLVDAVREASA